MPFEAERVAIRPTTNVTAEQLIAMFVREVVLVEQLKVVFTQFGCSVDRVALGTTVLQPDIAARIRLGKIFKLQRFRLHCWTVAARCP